MSVRIDGRLTRWNDSRGFGFITADDSGEEVFVHVSEFPQDGIRPTVGETLSFEIHTDDQGRRKAAHLFCSQRTSPVRRAPESRRGGHSNRTSSPSLSVVMLKRLMPLLVLAGLAIYGYGQYIQKSRPQATPIHGNPPIARPASKSLFQEQPQPQRFSCDGRIHCSQMRSCAEATYFLRNCPGVKMDGDRDGVPCEQQWCP